MSTELFRYGKNPDGSIHVMPRRAIPLTTLDQALFEPIASFPTGERLREALITAYGQIDALMESGGVIDRGQLFFIDAPDVKTAVMFTLDFKDRLRVLTTQKGGFYLRQEHQGSLWPIDSEIIALTGFLSRVYTKFEVGANPPLKPQSAAVFKLLDIGMQNHSLPSAG